MTITLDTIKSRCEEVGDCHIWQGAISTTGYPIIKTPEGCQLVRRLVVQLAGKPLLPRQPVACTCNERHCVNPEHLQPSTIRAVAQRAAQRGSYLKPERIARITQTKRATAPKLTAELAAQIRSSTEPGPALARRLGVHRSMIPRIRSGKAWRDHTNPWAGLMR